MKIMMIVLCIVCFLLGFMLCKVLDIKVQRSSTQKVIISLDKIRANAKRTLAGSHWATIKEKNIGISDFFKDNGWFHVAVYGYSKLAKIFIEEAEKQGITIDYIIDVNAPAIKLEKSVYSLTDKLPVTDVIVVCIPEAATVREILREKNVAPSFSLMDLLELLGK